MYNVMSFMHTKTHSEQKQTTHLKNVLNMLVMPEFSVAVGAAAVSVSELGCELDGEEALDGDDGNVTADDE